MIPTDVIGEATQLFFKPELGLSKSKRSPPPFEKGGPGGISQGRQSPNPP